MQTIRTTITLPQNVYNDLRQQAFEENKSFGEVFSFWYRKIKLLVKQPQVNQSVKSDFAVFNKVAQSSKRIDTVNAVREERDRDV